jgi:hypothetical protein
MDQTVGVSGFDSRQEDIFCFSTVSGLALWPVQSCIQQVFQIVSLGVKQLMYGAVSPLLTSSWHGTYLNTRAVLPSCLYFIKRKPLFLYSYLIHVLLSLCQMQFLFSRFMGQKLFILTLKKEASICI